MWKLTMRLDKDILVGSRAVMTVLNVICASDLRYQTDIHQILKSRQPRSVAE